MPTTEAPQRELLAFPRTSCRLSSTLPFVTACLSSNVLAFVGRRLRFVECLVFRRTSCLSSYGLPFVECLASRRSPFAFRRLSFACRRTSCLPSTVVLSARGDMTRLLGMRTVAFLGLISEIDSDVALSTKARVVAGICFSKAMFWDSKYHVSQGGIVLVEVGSASRL